jgi:hypothetical protein
MQAVGIRGLLLITAMAAIACSRSPHELKRLLPAEVEPGWRLVHAADMNASDLPQILAGMPWRQAIIAEYRQGDSQIHVRMIEMKSERDAGEIARKWNRNDWAVFRRGEILVFTSGPVVPKPQVSDFARTLENSIQAS